jgi:histidinol-phosphate aminotransferase
MTGARRPLIEPRESVRLHRGYYSPQLDVAIALNANEAPEPPPPAYIEALAAELGRIALNRYPERTAHALRVALGALHGLGPETIYPANGSNEVLQSLFLAYGGPGRTALVFEPTYALHSHIASVTNTECVKGVRGPGFLVTPEEIAGRIEEITERTGEGPALVFLCSPNNPTGRLESEESIDAALELAPGLVVVDEAYGQFAPRSVLERREEHENLVVVRTFSKTWSLAALRLGYAVADPRVVEAAFEVTLPYHLDAFKQAAGVAALAYGAEMTDRTARLVQERIRLLDALGKLDVETCPSDANFICFRPRNRSAAQVWSSLLEHSVLVRDVSGYAQLDGYLRVTVGTPEENGAFVAALEAALEASPTSTAG